MNYFKKMIGYRRMNDDGWAANYGVAGKAGYRNSERHKELIKRDRRAKKKWVKNHENKLLIKDELLDTEASIKHWIDNGYSYYDE